MSDILDKSRRAMVAYIAAGNVGTTNIQDGKSSAEKEPPLVGCDAANAIEDPTGTGNFWVDLEVTVRSIGAVDADGVDPKTAGDTLTLNVLGLLEIDNDSLKAALSSLSIGFTVQGFDVDKSIEFTADGDTWITTWKRRAYCSGASV